MIAEQSPVCLTKEMNQSIIKVRSLRVPIFSIGPHLSITLSIFSSNIKGLAPPRANYIKAHYALCTEMIERKKAQNQIPVGFKTMTFGYEACPLPLSHNYCCPYVPFLVLVYRRSRNVSGQH